MAFCVPLGCLAGRTSQWSGHLRGGRDQHRCRLWVEQASGNVCKAHTRCARVCKGCVKGLSTQATWRCPSAGHRKRHDVTNSILLRRRWWQHPQSGRADQLCEGRRSATVLPARPTLQHCPPANLKGDGPRLPRGRAPCAEYRR